MKVALVLALVACAAALPTPEADPQLLYTSPLVTYPVVKTVKADTPASTVPLVYSYNHGLPLTYSYNYPYALPYSYPFNFPYTYVVKADEAAVEKA